MRAKMHPIINCRGFTILEVVVTLTVASVLGTVIFMYMDTSLTQSVEPITHIQKSFSLNQIIEQITADYKDLLDNDDTPLQTLKAKIEDAGNIYGQDSGTADFILFDTNNQEASGGDRILKAVISSNNKSITVLFTK